MGFWCWWCVIRSLFCLCYPLGWSELGRRRRGKLWDSHTDLASSTHWCQGISFVATAWLWERKKKGNVHCWMTKEMGRKIKESFYNGDGDAGTPASWCEIQRRPGAHGCRAVSTFPITPAKILLPLFLLVLHWEGHITFPLSSSYWKTSLLRNTDYNLSWGKCKL